MANADAPNEKTRLNPTGRMLQGGQSSTLSVKQLVNDFPDEEAGPTWFKDYLRPCVAEFFAVMIFVFVGTMSVVTGTPIGVATAHGFTIALLVANFGPVSGGHINPAVTLGVCIAGGVSPLKALLYLISQLIGAVTGAGICRGSLSYVPDIPTNVDNATQYALISGGAHTVPEGVPIGMAYLAEAGLTLVLVMTVLMTAVNTDAQNPIHPLCIGFAVLVDILAGMKVSGASMNPARSFGPAVMMSDLNNGSTVWKQQWLYWAGPATGALIAALFFRIIFGRADKRWIYKED